MRDELLERLLSQREWLRRFALDLVREPSLAEDVVQETWVAALRAPPGGDERSWLAAVARRAARFLRRSEGRRREREERAARPEATGSPAELVERIELEERLVRELRRLDEPFRATLLRRYFEGASAAEIARAEGIPEGTVRWRTSRGLAELRHRLAPALGEDESFARALAPLMGGIRGAFEVGGITGGVAMGWKAWSVAAAGLVGVLLVARAWHGEGAQAEEARASGAEVTLALATLPQETREPAAAAPPAREAAPTLDSATVARSAVRVLDAERRPLAGASVAWRAGADAEAVEATLDADGRLVFPPEAPATIELAIERPAHFPHVATLSLTPGEQELQLPAGQELSGRIVVDGGLPRRPLRLELFPRYGSDGRREPRPGLFERDRIRLTTDERGAFRFLGVTEDTYQLVLPAGHRLAGELDPGAEPYVSPSLRLTVEGEHVIELERFPSVRGRVLLADGTPVHAELNCRVRWNQWNSMDLGATTDEVGDFELFFERAWEQLWVTCEGRAGAHGTFEFSTSDLIDGELGNLVLSESSRATLRVLDEGGQPLAGAFTSLTRSPSGPDGRLELAGVAGPVSVAALGYRARELQPPASGELDVVLTPGPEFEIVVVDGFGVPIPEAPLRFEAERELFDGPDGWLEAHVWRNHPGRVGCHRSSGNRKEGGLYANFVCDGAGRWRKSSLLPGVPFLLRVGERNQPVFHEERVAGLGPDEHRRLDVVLDATCLTVRGRALDETGQPLPGVRPETNVALLHTHATADYCGSDARGRFDCTFLLPPDVDDPVVRFRRIGFRTRELAWDLDSDGARDLVLERGHVVALSVLDLDGRPIAGGEVTFRRSGETDWQRTLRLAPGVFEAGGLADGLHEFQLALAGRTTLETLSSDARELAFRVERPGSVRVRWHAPTDQPDPRWLDVSLLPLDPDEPRHDAEPSLDASGEFTFRAVLPGRYAALLQTRDEERIELARAEILVAPGESATVKLEAR